MQITIGLWIIPALLTFFALYWAFREDNFRGDYNFSAIFYIPAPGRPTGEPRLLKPVDASDKLS